MDEAELREQIAKDLAYWHIVCLSESYQSTLEQELARADQILALIKHAGYLPVELDCRAVWHDVVVMIEQDWSREKIKSFAESHCQEQI